MSTFCEDRTEVLWSGPFTCDFDKHFYNFLMLLDFVEQDNCTSIFLALNCFGRYLDNVFKLLFANKGSKLQVIIHFE